MIRSGGNRVAPPSFGAAATYFSEAKLAGLLWHKVKLGGRPLGAAEVCWCWGGRRYGRRCL
jgi:hypothetical protein